MDDCEELPVTEGAEEDVDDCEALILREAEPESVAI